MKNEKSLLQEHFDLHSAVIVNNGPIGKVTKNVNAKTQKNVNAKNTITIRDKKRTRYEFSHHATFQAPPRSPGGEGKTKRFWVNIKFPKVTPK